MAEFSVNVKYLKGQIDEEEKMAQELANIQCRLESQLREIEGLGSNYRYIGDSVRRTSKRAGKRDEAAKNRIGKYSKNI